MKLIDKDALVAEIERLKAEALQKKSLCKRSGLEKIIHQIGVYNKILSFLDTLEMKEVDLEKYYHEFLEKEWFGNSHVRTVSEMMAFTAKHFFELGLKAQKGEDI